MSRNHLIYAAALLMFAAGLYLSLPPTPVREPPAAVTPRPALVEHWSMPNTGPKFPATVSSIRPPGADWSGPSNAAAENGSTAAVSLDGGSDDSSGQLRATAFALAVPETATIDGIVVRIKNKYVGTGIGGGTLQLVSGGSVLGDAKSGNVPGSSLAWDSIGGAADLWGAALTPADVNDSTFGVQYSNGVDNYDKSGTLEVDAIEITVFYSAAGPAMPPRRKSMSGTNDLME